MNEYAIVRDIPDSYNQCVTNFQGSEPINVVKAKLQHQEYCRTLIQLGLKLIRMSADNSLPDCCFTEDPAIVFDDIAIIAHPGTPSRITETIEMKKTLMPLKKLHYLTPPATLEGGDVLKIGKKIFIGHSARTNEEGIKQVSEIISSRGYEVIAVKIWDTLHLKSVCTYLGNGCIIHSEGHFDDTLFSAYDKIIVPKEEEYAANTLLINDKVLIPKGFPKTKTLIENKGFSVIELEMTEIEKAEGALTCLSVIFN